MNVKERYEKYNDEDFDTLMLKIRRGDIKCGKYANRIKIDKNAKIGKELFKDDGSEIQRRE